MKFIMKIIFLINFFMIFPIYAKANDLICKELTEFSRNTNKNLPKKMDEISTLVQIRINCENMNITYVRTIDVPFSALSKGFRERKQQQHTELHCNKDGLANVGKWTVRDTLQDVNLDSILLITRPQDCVG